MPATVRPHAGDACLRTGRSGDCRWVGRALGSVLGVLAFAVVCFAPLTMFVGAADGRLADAGGVFAGRPRGTVCIRPSRDVFHRPRPRMAGIGPTAS